MQNKRTSNRLQHSIYSDDHQHIRAIDRLVHELGLPSEEVNCSYRETLDTLKMDNRIRVFLPILVSQKVKEKLQHKCNGQCDLSHAYEIC